ncbi:MAG: hypothetical protein HY235_04540 [Acidobacteria bacterium]|nr:hypothetical protein [Acidobacteriota bacterium]
MGLDLRLPIGLLLAVIGLLLAGFGLASGGDIYRRSLGINVNLWWGGVLLAVGIILLISARRNRSAE